MFTYIGDESEPKKTEENQFSEWKWIEEEEEEKTEWNKTKYKTLDKNVVQRTWDGGCNIENHAKTILPSTDYLNQNGPTKKK